MFFFSFVFLSSFLIFYDISGVIDAVKVKMINPPVKNVSQVLLKTEFFNVFLNIKALIANF